MMQGNKSRTFTRVNSNGDLIEFAEIGVSAVSRGGDQIVCDIDQVTGEITLPELMQWKNVRDWEDAKNLKRLVTSFNFSVLTPTSEPVVVTQRIGRTNQYHGTHALKMSGIQQHGFPPCEVKPFWDPEEEALEVNTAPMNRGKSNRIDIWTLDQDGVVELHCIYLITLDNGESFNLVHQRRWKGKVYRRKPGTTYQLPVGADNRAQQTYKVPGVRDLLERLVFVPGDYAENFVGRMGILENPDFRVLLGGLPKDLPIWNGPEDFWMRPVIATPLALNQAVVDFFTYGVGKGSFGILQLVKPFKVGDVEHSSLQFNHWSVEGNLLDEQGIFQLYPGMIVDFGNVVDMGLDQSGKPHPAKALRVIPRYDPLPQPVAPSTLRELTSA